MVLRKIAVRFLYIVTFADIFRNIEIKTDQGIMKMIKENTKNWN